MVEVVGDAGHSVRRLTAILGANHALRKHSAHPATAQADNGLQITVW